MVGYGPEQDHFVIELTYNYGVKSYELGNILQKILPNYKFITIFYLGNEFGGITIRSKEVIERAKKNNYEMSVENNLSVLKSPDGYTFFILDESQPLERGMK